MGGWFGKLFVVGVVAAMLAGCEASAEGVGTLTASAWMDTP